MKIELLRSLQNEANGLAAFFSQPERKALHTGEDFKVVEITPLSESTASVILEKTKGQYAFVWFYHQKKWKWIIPTDSHISGMRKAEKILQGVEKHNAKVKFDLH